MTFASLHGQAHVWLLRTGDHSAEEMLAQYRSVLCEHELQRHRRYLREESRHTFAIARGALRRVLSGYAGDVAPAQWVFATGEHGRPEIDEPREFRALRFNVSHTRGLIALVVTDALDCGIDVEETASGADVAKIARRVFSARELGDLLAQPPEGMRRRFHEFWTLKEAYIKATGLGMAQNLREFAFEIAATGEVAVHFAASIHDDPSHWQFECRRPTEYHQMAVALRTGDDPGGRPLAVRVRSLEAPAT